jgi:hypothetical protein
MRADRKCTIILRSMDLWKWLCTHQSPHGKSSRLPFGAQADESRKTQQPPKSQGSNSGNGSNTLKRLLYVLNSCKVKIKANSKKDTNKSIDPSYLAPIFSGEGKKVASLPGIKAEHVEIASEYMQSQVRQEWPSEFLTSDLMIHLEGVGTVGGSRKASL